MKPPKMPKVLAKIQRVVPSMKVLRTAFDPAKRERDMLAQAKEDGCYGADHFQKGSDDPSI